MHRGGSKRLSALLLAAVTAALAPAGAAAATYDAAYSTYQLNQKEEPVLAPTGYTCTGICNLNTLDAKIVPRHMTLTADGELFVSDGKSGEVIVYGTDLIYRRRFPVTEAGEALTNIDGLYTTGSGAGLTLYAADPDRHRIVTADAAGRVTGAYTHDGGDDLADTVDFKPTRVLVDSHENVYAIVPGVYAGALLFDTHKAFVGYYGSLQVEVTPTVLLNAFWKSLFNSEQKSQMQRYVPMEYVDFDITGDDFVYTVTAKTQTGATAVKKLNMKSENILEETLQDRVLQGTDTNFLAVSCLKDGLYAALDSASGRVYVYSADGELMTMFGGIGDARGLFRAPIALSADGLDLFVLDQNTKSVSKFVPTEYGKALMQAHIEDRAGQYLKAQPLWEQVLRDNGNCLTAYNGVGKALMTQGRYEEAMAQFRQGLDRGDYAFVLGSLRKQRLQAYFPVLFALLLAFVVFLLYPRRGKKVYAAYKVDMREKPMVRKVAYALFHPSDGNEVLLRHTAHGAAIPVCLMALWVAVASCEWLYTGFCFNRYTLTDFNLLTILATTVLIYGVFIVCNWLVSTMMAGSGKLRDIAIVTAVSLLPYMAGQVLRLLLSNVLLLDEAAFLSICTAVGVLWSALLLLRGMGQIHEFELAKTLSLLLFTLFAMLVVAFLLLLTVSLFQQMGLFVYTIWNEFSYMT